MHIFESSLPGVFVIEPKVFGDNRGFFLETYRQDCFCNAGIKDHFVQDNHSRSTKGILRGLHYQLTQPQGKLVRVSKGMVFDVAVDIRVGSPNFGKWFAEILDEDSMRMMYIPPGFAHGFIVLSDEADFIYKCTDYYHPESEQGIIWSDPEVGIDWPCLDIKLSDKDGSYSCLKDIDLKLLPTYSI